MAAGTVILVSAAAPSTAAPIGQAAAPAITSEAITQSGGNLIEVRGGHHGGHHGGGHHWGHRGGHHGFGRHSGFGHRGWGHRRGWRHHHHGFFPWFLFARPYDYY